MNLDRLKGKLVEKGKTYEDCARHIGVSITTFSKKMNNKSKWYVDEIIKLGQYLGLDNKEMVEIFLGNNLHDVQAG